MRIPEALSALVDHGIIQRVVRPLMSGKEAQIYLIEAGGQQCVAKVYKDVQDRTFQNRADYTEGRKVRNTRDQRAMNNRSKHGRAQNEAAWKNTEVDMIYRLRDAGVRVPTPYNFIDGVLIMELVCDAEGNPAPRLGDLTFEAEEATQIFQALLAEVVRMLCAGVVHGDLSDFNVLVDANGPVIIDFPQAVDAASNQNARKFLLRDVDNLHRFHAKFAPGVRALPYAQEAWELYQRNALVPSTRLTGKFRGSDKVVSTDAVLDLIADANRDEQRRRDKLGLKPRERVPEQRAAPEAREPGGRALERVERGPWPAQRGQQPAQREQRPAQREQRPAQREPHQAQREQRPAQREPHQAQREQRQAREQRPAQREPHQVQREQRQSREQRPTQREQQPAQREQASARQEGRAWQPREQVSSKWGQHRIPRRTPPPPIQQRTVDRTEQAAPRNVQQAPVEGPRNVGDEPRPRGGRRGGR